MLPGFGCWSQDQTTALLGRPTRAENNDWQFWQQHNKPIQILDNEMFHQKLTYIHNNPVEAGFVERAEDWLYSSAGNFYGKKGSIELSYII